MTDKPLDVRLNTLLNSFTGVQYLNSQQLLIVIGESALEFPAYSLLNPDSQRLKFKFKLTGEETSVNRELLELEHGERQEITRDIHNKVTREDIDVLDRYHGFKHEQIVKVITKEDKEDGGVTRIYVFTDSNYVYVYQIISASNQGKVSLTIE